MNRYTEQSVGGFTSQRSEKELIDRLGRFENVVDEMNSERQKISQELAALREQGKSKTARFAELMSKKLSLADALARLKAYGLD